MQKTQADFWAMLEDLTAHLKNWNSDEHCISSETAAICEKIALLMRGEEALINCADPRNGSRIRSIREMYGDRWSLINSRLEFQFAEEIFDKVKTIEDFFAHVDAHPIFNSGAARAKTEIRLLQEYGVEAKGLKIAMIGPGAMPYSALAFAQAGAHVTAIDCYQPACEWLNKWFEKLLNEGTYQTKKMWAQDENYAQYDVVIVASMLLQKHIVIEAIERSAPQFVFVRSTASRHPLSLFAHQPGENDLLALKSAQFISDTASSFERVSTFSLLYKYPDAAAA